MPQRWPPRVYLAARPVGWRRHVPYGLFLVAATLLLAALARPQVNLAVPRREGTVMLAFDVSNSMAAEDLAPTRMEAAKAAARRFVQAQPDSIKVGVVSFSEAGFVTQPPALDRAATLGAIDRLAPQGGTSLGQGLYASLGVLTTIGSRPDASDRAEPPPQPPILPHRPAWMTSISAMSDRRRSCCSPTGRTPPSPTRSTWPNSPRWRG